MTYRYPLAGGGTTTASFSITWNAGSVTIYYSGGSYTQTGYWVSECVDLSDGISCASEYECARGCSAVFYFFCRGTFKIASDAWNASGCTGNRYNGGFLDCEFYPPLSGPYDYGESGAATTCDPFYWRYPSGGTADYTVSE